MKKKIQQVNAAARQRYFRRTNVYIAEYILMLVTVGAFVGLLSTMLFSIANVFQSDGLVAASMSVFAIGQLGALTVVAPAALWFYARVSGQEMVQPELRNKASRTVFLSIWLIAIFMTIVSVSISVMTGFIGLLINGEEIMRTLLGVILPGALAIMLLAATVIVVAHRTTRRLSLVATAIAAGLAVVVFISTLVAVLITKNQPIEAEARVLCSYNRYIDGDCTYREYRESKDDERRNNAPRSLRGSNRFNSIDRPTTRY